ncbi:MAG: hypothetical protein M3430_05130 [Acidobacteriota bacterium]|nr:hypothetical protein [Acidobacteriota bacterium]
MRKLAILIILVATAVVALPQEPPRTAGAQSDAQKAFEKMKTLAGSTEGSIGGMSMQVTIRLTSAGSAIMHDATRSNMPGNHEITMMYLEGDRLLMTHYSNAGNRQRFEGKLSPDGKSVEFNLLDVAGSTQRGFMKRIMFTTIDANKHVVELTFIQPDGKPLEVRGEFQRTK